MHGRRPPIRSPSDPRVSGSASAQTDRPGPLRREAARFVRAGSRWPPSSLVTSRLPTAHRPHQPSPPEAGPSVSATSLDSFVRRSCTARTGLPRPCGHSPCTSTCTRPAPCTRAWPGFSRVGSAHDAPRPHTGRAIPTLHVRSTCSAHSACASLTKKVACGCSPASSSEMPVLASVPTKRG